MSAPHVFSLEGHTALITGGGSGIGLATAHALAAGGAKVILGGRREKELNDAVAAIGAAASAQVMDVTDTAAMPALAAALREKHGPISILVNNAGINLKKPFVDTAESELLGILQTNVIGAMALTRAVHPQLKESGQGSVVFISSMAALFGIPWVSAYSISKSALTGAVRTLSLEFGADNIRVNAVAPGWIDTAMSRKAFASDPARKEKILSRTPLGVLGDTSDIGWSVAYLCSPAAKFVTGAILPVDGGASIGF
ncbi:MAG: SDR family oxidoreductase [Opitutaceae bacterium]|jgi:gluconate 5-dehydrogenase|nr:SDR family oxidoreductase [Cephaloticoccus sp.]MCP5530001.1 SDR family oxidoreductase [Opitutaceae bacterium]